MQWKWMPAMSTGQPREEDSNQRHETFNPNAPELQIQERNLPVEM